MKLTYLTLIPILLLMACGGARETQQEVTYTFEGAPELRGQLSPERKALLTFHEAMEAKVLGNIDRAEERFKKVIDLAPKNDAAYYELARIYLEKEEMETAAMYAQQALSLQPDNQFYLEINARLYQSFGERSKALEIYKQLKERFPNNAGYYLELAYLQQRTGQVTEAIATYNDLEQQFGIEEQVVIQKHKLYLSQGDLQNAEAELKKLITAYPNEGKYYGMLGEMYEMTGRPQQAIEAYKSLMAKDPGNPFAALSMANFYRKAGEEDLYDKYIDMAFANATLPLDIKINHLLTYIDIIKVSESRREDAYRLGEMLISTHPDEAKAFAMYGDLLYNGGHKKKALAQFEQALALNTGVYSVWEQVLYITAELMQWEKLKARTDEAMSVFPNQPLPYFLQGVALNQLDQPEKAIAVLDRALLIGASNKLLTAEVYAAMGDSYHALEQHAASDSCYAESLERNPDNAVVLNNFAYYMSLRKKNLDKCEEMARKANELQPGNASFQDTYGWILYQQGQYEQARLWLEKAVESSHGNSAVILEHLGDTLFQLGKVDAAVDYWNRALEAGGASEDLEQKIKNRTLYE